MFNHDGFRVVEHMQAGGFMQNQTFHIKSRPNSDQFNQKSLIVDNSPEIEPSKGPVKVYLKKKWRGPWHFLP